VTVPDTTSVRPRRRWLQGVLVLVVVLIAAMWVYAFFFAPTEGVNRIGDREWSARGETRCADAKTQLLALADFRPIEDAGPDALTEKAAIVDQTNEILTAMIDDLAADVPSDVKGQEIVPKWIADYRTYLGDRLAHAERLRNGENVALAETEVNGTPISSFINDFARQNEMPGCQTPVDLSL
jgi:hypothetical protein